MAIETELVVALLGSPVVIAALTFIVRIIDSHRAHRTATKENALARLEQENARAAERSKAAESRIEELEAREDALRATLDKERERTARLRRILITHGLEDQIPAEETAP